MREKGRYKNVNKKCDKNELKHKYSFTRFVRLRATALRSTPQEISRRHRELRCVSSSSSKSALIKFCVLDIISRVFFFLFFSIFFFFDFFFETKFLIALN